MVLNKTVQDIIADYTFIDKVEMKNGMVLIHYGGNRYKKVPYRATPDQLIPIIEDIKREMGFAETKEKRDEIVKKELKKPMIFGNL